MSDQAPGTYAASHATNSVKAAEKNEAIAALAESWASIDGKLAGYQRGKSGNDFDGYFDGYNIEAAEMIVRMEKRGFTVVRVSP